MDAPPEKKQKTTDDKDEEIAEGEATTEAQKEAEAEPPKAPEKAKELEEDAPTDKSAKIKDKVTFLLPDTTMNVLPSTVGNLLACATEGGLAQLAACARANVGIKSGRYMFEAKIVDQPPTPDGRRQPHGPTRSFRIGFSAEGSLFLGEEENSICFDLDGYLVYKGKGKKCSWPFFAHSVVAVVLNLDSSSPNHNTVSLFLDGKRACDPQPLPDALKDQALFPAISWKTSTVHVNFGPTLSPLPFTCRTVEEASAKDAVVNKYEAPSDGKYTALFPVCLPDEGTFDWLDLFKEKNPDYVEFSDRAFMQWGVKSGISKDYGGKKSNDKPGISFHMDSVRQTLLQVLSMRPRNLVYMEVKSNLIKEGREIAVAKFQSSGFKIVADVLVGDPLSSFKKVVHAKVLQAKQAVVNAESKAKYIEKKREWANRKREKDRIKKAKQAEKDKLKRQKEVAEARKKFERENKKKAKEAAAKKAEEEGKPVEEEAEAEEKEEEEEEKKEEEPEEMDTEEPDEPEPIEDDPPTAELTAEDKALRFFKNPVPDLTSYELSTSMSKFSLPEAQEGFTTVKYSWSKDKAAADYLKSWLLEKKLTTRVEDIQPSQWFKDQNNKWAKDLADWKTALNDYKAIVSKREADKAQKAQRKLVAEKKAQVEAERKAKEEAEKAKADTEKKEEGKEEEKKEEEKKEEEKKEEEKPKAMEVEEKDEAEDDPAVDVDFEGIDIFGLDNVGDLGGKMPLLKEFTFEDFALMSLRVELHLLAHSFIKDVNDEDRTGVHLDHLSFYYHRYFGKQLNLNSYGVQKIEELIALVNDTIYTPVKTKVIKSAVPADIESYAVFVKLTESARRHRALMLDLGEESAKLKIVPSYDDRRRDDRGGKGDDRKGGGGQKRSWGPGAFGKGMYSSMVQSQRVAGKDKEGKGEKRAWNQDGKAYGKGNEGAVGKGEEVKGYGKKEDNKGYGKRDDGKGYGKREESKGFVSRESYGKREDSKGYGKRDDHKGFGKRDDFARRDDSKGYARRDDSKGYGKQAVGYGARDDSKGYSSYGKREDGKGGKGDWKAAGGKASKGKGWSHYPSEP